MARDTSWGICPVEGCERKLKMMVKLWLWVDVTEQSFNKTALRRKEIQVHYAESQELDKWVCPDHGFPFRDILKPEVE